MKLQQNKPLESEMNSGQGIVIQSSENIVKNPYKQQGWTNDVLICQKKNETEIFLPCYLRTKLKNIMSLDYQTGKGAINVVIILSLYYGQVENILPQFLQKIRQTVILRFKIDPAIKLSEGFTQFEDDQGNKRSNYVIMKVDQDKKLITYSIRGILVVPLVSYIFWSPFQYIKYVSTISIDSFNIYSQNVKFKVSFNMMDLSEEFDKYTVVSFTEQGALGEYNLARSLITAKFSNDRCYIQSSKKSLKDQFLKNSKQVKDIQLNSNQDQKQILNKDSIRIKAFKYGHSVFPVYRHPLVPYVSLFLPIVVLGFLNLAIFFQDNRQSGKRIVNIATLLVSYVAFLPTIRTNLPPSSSLVISQILLFSIASLTILCLAHTIKVRNLEQYEFVWNEDSLFIATFIITLIILGFWLFIWITFYLVFYKNFNTKEKRTERKFNRKQWLNRECDDYFNKLRSKGLKIKPLFEQGDKSSILEKRQIDRKNQESSSYLKVKL